MITKMGLVKFMKKLFFSILLGHLPHHPTPVTANTLGWWGFLGSGGVGAVG